MRKFSGCFYYSEKPNRLTHVYQSHYLHMYKMYMYVYCRKLSAVTYILASILLMFVVTFKCLNSHLGRCLETSTLEVGWNPQFLSGDKLVVWVKQFPLLCHTGFNCGSRSLTFITATGLHRLKLWFDVNPLHHWATQSSIVVWGQPTSPLGHTSFKCGLRPTHFTIGPHKFQMWSKANPLHHWRTVQASTANQSYRYMYKWSFWKIVTIFISDHCHTKAWIILLINSDPVVLYSVSARLWNLQDNCQFYQNFFRTFFNN